VSAYDAAGNVGGLSNVAAATTLGEHHTTRLVRHQLLSLPSTGATVSWTTNEPADGQVAYGLTSDYGSTFSQQRVGYQPLTRVGGPHTNTTYHYQVSSADAAANLGTSTDFTFTTPPLTPPVISAVKCITVYYQCNYRLDDR